jgi:hypothetical protein
MKVIRVQGTINEAGNLEIELPAGVLPPGPVEMTIQSLVPTSLPPRSGGVLTREEAIARMEAAGLRSKTWTISDDGETLSDEDLARVGRKMAGTKLTSEYIDEDRGEY